MALVAGLVLLVMHWRQVWTFIQKDIPVVARIFTATWKAATAAFNAVWKWAVNAVHASVKWFDDNVLKWLNKRLKDLTSWWHANSAEIAQVWALMWTVIKNEADLVWGFIKAGLDILKSAWVLAWHLLKNTVNLVWGAISSAVTFAMHLVLNTISLLMDVLTGKWGKAWRDLLKLVTQAFSDIGRFLGGLASDFGTLLWDAGADLIKGLIGGIKSMAGAAVNAAKDVGTSALHGVKSVLGIKSPSRVFRDEVGKWIPHGIAAGITAHAGVAHDAMREVANGTVTSLSGGLSSAVARMGTAPALAGGAPGGRGPVVHNHVHVEVHGTVRSDRDLRDLFQQEMLRLGGRNSATWQPYRR
jgi:phage-related protein